MSGALEPESQVLVSCLRWVQEQQVQQVLLPYGGGGEALTQPHSAHSLAPLTPDDMVACCSPDPVPARAWAAPSELSSWRHPLCLAHCGHSHGVGLKDTPLLHREPE